LLKNCQEVFDVADVFNAAVVVANVLLPNWFFSLKESESDKSAAALAAPAA